MHINKFIPFAILFAIILLAGCATTDPVIKVVTQRVEVPVPVACKEEAPAVPDYCFSKLTESNDIYDKSKCLLSDRDRSIGYETELLSKFNACK